MTRLLWAAFWVAFGSWVAYKTGLLALTFLVAPIAGAPAAYPYGTWPGDHRD